MRDRLKGETLWRRSFHSSQRLRVTPETGRRETGISPLTQEGEGRVMRKSFSMLKGMGTATGEPVAVKAARRVRKGEVRKGLAEIPPERFQTGQSAKQYLAGPLPYTEYGQELWQIACQWVWNLRLALGLQMQAAPVRDTLVGSRQRSSSYGRGCGKRTGRVRSVAVGQTVGSCNGTLRG